VAVEKEYALSRARFCGHADRKEQITVEEAEGFRDEAGGDSENRMKSLAFHGILPEIGSIFVFYFDFEF